MNPLKPFCVVALALIFMAIPQETFSANGQWSQQIDYGSGMVSAGNTTLGTVSSLSVSKAGFNAWSDNGMWWNNAYFLWKVNGQDQSGGFSGVNLPRTGGSGNDSYFGWNTTLNINLLSGLTYRGTYDFSYQYEARDNGGKFYSSVYTQSFTITTGDYYASNSGASAISQSAFNGGSSTLTGSVKLDKFGTGQINLTDNNDYTGTTTVYAGSLEVQTANSLGSTAAGTTVNSGAELRLWHASGVTVAAEGLTLNGDGIGSNGALRNISGNNTWQGAISNNNGARINSDAGKLTISGSITSGTQNFYVGGTGNVDITGAVSGSASTGNGALYKDGAGTLTLTGNNTGLTGLVRVLGGTASIATANNIGSGTVEIGGTGRLSTTATLTRTAGLTVTDASTGASIDVASETTFTQTGAFTGAANSNTKIGKSGAGTLILNAASGSTFGGQIQIGEGTVVAGTTGALGNNSGTVNRGVDLGLNVADQATGTGAALLASGGVTVSQSVYVAPTNSNSQRTIGLSGSGTATFNNEIRMEAGSSLTVRAGASSTDQVTISGAITGQNGTTQNLIKNEAGTLVLSGGSANTYGGNTTINSGTLRLAKTAGVNAIASGTIAVNSGGTLLLGAANQIGDTTDITLSGGTLSTDGNADAVKKLTVSANSTIQGMNPTSGSAFTFSDIDLGTYSGTGGSTLTFLNSSGTSYALGTVIQLSTVAASSWTGFGADRTVALNNFESKISFADANLKAQINFGGGTTGTTLTVAAIPEPKVYIAAGALALLIAYAELRRRRKAVSSKA